jgi:hypothetical protein
MRGIICLGLFTLLGGCASDSYWVKTHDPIEVKHVVSLDYPCTTRWYQNKPSLGCANYPTNTIEIKRPLSQLHRGCVEGHERKHFAGFSHDIERPHYATDCGNGTLMIIGE